MTTVFLSHASQDDKLIDDLLGWLTANGFTDVFVDRDRIRVGDHWREALRNAKASCRLVLCLVTVSWLTSDECYSEFLAGWYAGKRIMPLLCVGTTALDDRQRDRLSRVLAEDQGVDLSPIGAPFDLEFESQPQLTNGLILGLRAGGALEKVGFDPLSFEIDVSKRPEPFPGLDSFGDDDADAAIFFGRSPEIASCIEDLRQMRASGDRRAYTIVGASGSGKSSLMKAGVLPRLRRERGWLVLRAFRPGSDPLFNFADAIVRTAFDHQLRWASGTVHEELLIAWREARGKFSTEITPVHQQPSIENQRNFDNILLAALSNRLKELRDRIGRPTATCLIAMDQGEELGRSQEEGGQALGDFIAAMLAVPADGSSPVPYSVVLTVRDDGFSELRASERFKKILTRVADIRPLPLYRYAHAIELPAERYGVQMEPNLVQAMMEDAPEHDALPLVAFALRRLWTRFSIEQRIRKSNYELFGKLPGLIEDAAERALRGMDPRDDSPLTPARVSAERERRVARLFVPGLAHLNDLGIATRRLASQESLTDEDREILSPFGRWRLVIMRGNTVEVSHEATFREWPRFAEWLRPERERLDVLRNVEYAAENWVSHGRKAEYLTHRGRRLASAEELWKFSDYRRQLEATASIRPYLDASRRMERGRKWAAGGTAAIVLVSVTTLVVSNQARLRDFVETATHAPAAMPGSSYQNESQRSELQIRRKLLRADLARLVGEAFAGAEYQKGSSAGVSDSWALGQITAALGPGVVDRTRFHTYFMSQIVPACNCWAPIEGGQHAGATSWILLAHAAQGVAVPIKVLEGVLARQTTDGGWPMFFDAQRETANNSSYATALILLALHSLAKADLVEPTMRVRVQKATGAARLWLHQRARQGAYWMDYPDAPASGRSVRSRGNTAFIVTVLIRTGADEVDGRLFKEWLDALPQPTSLDYMDTSDQFVRLADNRGVRRDGTRYVTLAWEMAAISEGAVNLSSIQRIRARRFYADAFRAWPRDQSGRFEFLTAETLFAVEIIIEKSQPPA